jgi:pilus assembly protein CpaF
MVLMAGLDLPARAIRRQIATAVQLVVHVERFLDGSRRIVRVSEVAGMEGDTVTMADLAVFRVDGSADGRVSGRIVPTGVRAQFQDRPQRRGVTLPTQ